MALGTYGTVRPADMSPEDVEIILNYTPSRDVTTNFVLTKLNAADVLTPYFHSSTTGGNADVEILGGLYNLKLPAEEFNKTKTNQRKPTKPVSHQTDQNLKS